MFPVVDLYKINDIKFVPEFVSIPEKYSRFTDDKTWFKDTIRRWQGQSKYKQKRQFDDVQTIVIGAALGIFDDVTLEIYDDCGNLIEDGIETKFAYLTPNRAKYVDENGSATDLGLHYWNFQTNDYITTKGVYYYVIRCVNALVSVDDRLYISEPVYVRDQWDETIVIECLNKTNRGELGVIFNFVPNQDDVYTGVFFTPVFKHRVEGDIVDYDFENNDSQFVEQDYEVREMRSFAWKEPILNIGGSLGVPMYLFDKINTVFTCDNIKVNDTRYNKADGAKWQMDKAEQSPLFNGEINLRTYNSQDETADTTGNVITLFVEPNNDPAANPYYIYLIGFVGQPLLSGEYVDSDAYLTQLQDYLTDDVVNILQLRGSFDFTGGTWTYTNAYGESYLAEDFIVLTIPFDIELSVTGTNQVMPIGFSNTVFETYGGIVWGDGTWGNFLVPASSSATISHTYASVSTPTVRVYANSRMEQISLLRNVRTVTVENLTGYLPVGTTNFTMSCNTNTDLANLTSDLLDLEFLRDCRKMIRQFGITFGSFLGFTGNIFATYPHNPSPTSPDFDNWLNLAGITFYRGKLTSTACEDWIVDFYDNTPKLTPIYMDLQQLPAAPVTNTPATTYKALLNLAGGNVVTD